MHAVMYYQNIKCSLIYFLVLIIVLSLNVCELQCSGISGNVLTNDNDTYNQRNILIDRFQNALMNDSEQLFTLQKALLLPRPIGGLCLTVKVTVKGKVADDTYVPVYSYYSCDYNNLCHYSTSKQFELLPAPVAPSIPRSLADFLRSNDIVQVLAALDPSFHVLINIISNEPILLGDLYYDDDLYSPLPPSKNYDIPVYVVIDKINITDVGGQIEDDITDALYVTLSWAKVYVESGENNPEKLEDISWIKDVSDSECFSTVTMMPSSTDHNLFPSLVTAKLIFCTSIFFNILILIFTVLYLDKVFTWIEQPQHKHLKDLYKASAIVFIFINLSTFLSDVLWHIDDSITLLDIYSHYVVHTDQDSISLTSFHYGTYLIMKVLFVFLVFTVDITVSCFSTCKHSHAYTRCSKVMHALALCQILWLVHRLATDTVLFIIAFVVAPAQALGMVTLLLSTVVCTVLFVSSLIKKCQGCRCTKYYLCNKNALSIILCTFLIATCTVGLIFTVTLLFIALVDNGLQSAGIGGFILSLVPPTAIFVIGLCINREFAVNFYHNVLTSSSTARPVTVRELEESTPTNEDVIIQPDEYTQLVQTSDSVAIDMEAHEKFEEKPYRPAQKIGL